MPEIECARELLCSIMRMAIGTNALHELHTMDPTIAEREASAHFIRAVFVFIILFVWFLSLPIVQSAYLRRKEVRS